VQRYGDPGIAEVHLVPAPARAADDDVAHDQPPAFPAMNFSNVSCGGSFSTSAISQRDGARSGQISKEMVSWLLGENTVRS
jgi:hypothetical protein